MRETEGCYFIYSGQSDWVAVGQRRGKGPVTFGKRVLHVAGTASMSTGLRWEVPSTVKGQQGARVTGGSHVTGRVGGGAQRGWS